jgi:MFS family permease
MSQSPPAAARDSALDLLRFRPFRLLFTIRFASQTASQMLGVVVGWHIYNVTGSALDLGLIGLVQFLPAVLLALHAGQIADRHDRRWILRACFAVELVVPLGFLALANTADPPLILFYVLLLVNASARAFEGPALQALLPSMVGRERLSRAIALSTSAQKLSTLLGPSLAGVIYLLGASVDYAACLALVVLAAWSAVLLPPPPFAERGGRKADLGTVFAGLRLIWGTPVLLALMSLDLLATFFGGVAALLPIFAKDILETGPWGFGLLRSAPAVGALLMALVMSRWPVRHAAGRLIFAGVAAYGVFTILFGLSENLVLSVICMIGVGAGDMLGQVLRQTIIQLRIPDDMRGRVAAVSGLSVHVGAHLGQFESGVTAVWFGAVGSVLLGGAAVLAVVATWMHKFPELRRIDAPDEPDQPDAPAGRLAPGRSPAV